MTRTATLCACLLSVLLLPGQFIPRGRLSGVNVAVTITVPTTASTYDNGTTATIDLSGTATSDRTVTGCTWTNSLGGNGSTTGTTSWSISAISLTVGSNVITVTCTHDGGVSGQDVLTVSRSSSSGHWPGTTRTAASCSPADVQTQITASSDGDIVIIPNGNCTWGSGVTVSGKGIYLKGQTAGSVRLTHGAGGTALLSLSADTTHHVGVGNLNFIRGSGTGEYITTTGSSAKVILVHNTHFDVPDNFSVLRTILWDALGGVFWSVTFESTTPGGGNGPGAGSGCLKITSPKPWLDTSTWGMQDTDGLSNLYIEDSTFLHIYNQAVDCDDNCRLVVRFSTIRNSQMLHHGTTSLQGGRQSEFYNNAFDYSPATFGNQFTDVNLNRYLWLRAGTTRLADNTIVPISSGTWGGSKSELVFMAESLTRSGAGSGCQLESAYPNGVHWSGFGANGTAQTSDPIRLWNNTGTWDWSTNDHDAGIPGFCNNGQSSANVILLNRDVILSDPGNYTKFTYPHPLRAGVP